MSVLSVRPAFTWTLHSLAGSFMLAFLCISDAGAACRGSDTGPVVLGAAGETLPGPDRLLQHLYSDRTGQLTLERIIERDRAGEFAINCSAHAAVPPNGALWVRIDAKAATDTAGNWVLYAGPFEIDDLRVHRVREGAPPRTYYSGRAVLPSERSTDSRWPSVDLFLPETETSRLYLRVASASGPYISLKFMPKLDFEARDRVDLVVLSAFFGFMVAMLVVNALIYMRGRQIQSVYYCLYLAFISAHVFFYDGPAYLLSPAPLHGAAADTISQGLAIVAGLFLLLCGRKLLDLPARMPQADKAILTLSIAMFAALAGEMAGWLPYAVASGICAGIAGVIMAGCAALQAIRGNRAARYFFASFVALLAVFAVDFIAFFIPETAVGAPWYVESLEYWLFPIGIIAESILIAFALSYFIRDMRGEVTSVRQELAVTARKAGVREKVESGFPSANPDKSSDEAFFEKALFIIQENLEDENFGVDRLAGDLAVSPRTLRRRIQAATGISPVEFLRQERLERARRHLAAGTFNSVAEVARAVGMPNASYFSRQFRTKYGQTPRAALIKPPMG